MKYCMCEEKALHRLKGGGGWRGGMENGYDVALDLEACKCFQAY